MGEQMLMRRGAGGSLVAPQTFTEVMTFAQRIAETDFVPEAMRGNAGAVLAAIQFGAELGVGPMQALRNIHVIKGKVGMSGDLMLGLARGTGELEEYEEHFCGAGKCPYCGAASADHAEWYGRDAADGHELFEGIVKIRRRGRPLRVYTFSKADALRVSVWEDRKQTTLAATDRYRSWPQRMYVMRARCFALRTEFADLYAGVYTPEELQDVVDGETVPQAADRSERTVEPEAVSPYAHLSEEMQQTLTQAFELVHWSPAQRRQKLLEFKGREEELLEVLRKEYADRRGIKPRPKEGPKPPVTPSETTAVTPSEQKTEPAEPRPIPTREAIVDEVTQHPRVAQAGPEPAPMLTADQIQW